MSSKFHRVTCAVAFAALLALGPRSFAQSDDGDPEMRVEQLENQLRQLTGQNEELQHQNQLLQERLRALQGGAQPAGPVGGSPAGQQPSVAALPPPQSTPAYQPPPQQGYQSGYPQQQGGAPAPIYQTEAPQGRPRGDAFDPSQDPNAPGVPRPLGGGRMPIESGGYGGPPPSGNPSSPGQPLNLGYPGAQSSANADAGGSGLATLPPSSSPRDEFDLGIGYMERKDYALAEQTMRNFMQKYPSDPLVADSQYWLGESLFQRQQYRDAAEAFLAVTSKYDKSAKAPDALLRLGQSLAALKQKDAACAAFGEVTKKYPRASSGVKAAVDREQRRVKC
ncbi:MAG TPA: tol-pal system protein YbgF [Bradyrhizobium sp.]|nr:tol-pal system protein YbgF [Bradyrhizobium sp.]